MLIFLWFLLVYLPPWCSLSISYLLSHTLLSRSVLSFSFSLSSCVLVYVILPLSILSFLKPWLRIILSKVLLYHSIFRNRDFSFLRLSAPCLFPSIVFVYCASFLYLFYLSWILWILIPTHFSLTFSFHHYNYATLFLSLFWSHSRACLFERLLYWFHIMIYQIPYLLHYRFSPRLAPRQTCPLSSLSSLSFSSLLARVSFSLSLLLSLLV